MTGSLSDLRGYVTDAFQRVPTKDYKPEDTVFGHYTYLPWVRTGIAAAITAPAAGTRAEVGVSLPIEGRDHPVLVSHKLVVRGPGDVLAINARQVIRRYPLPGTARAEDTFLAHIEFDRPDLPWIFTPAAPTPDGSRLPPWLALVVLRDSRSELTPPTGGASARVRTTLSELQPLDDSWAWAHAQLIGPVADPVTASVDDRLTPAYGDVNLSRLVCPRRLQPGQGYLACVVPAFDAGRRAGLGDTSGTPTLGPAWSRSAPDDEEVVLPVYTSWTFSTGPDGDFRSLAELLEGVAAPWQVGRRILDTAAPGGGLPDLTANAAGRLQTVHGPLVSLQQPNPGSADPVEVTAASAEHAIWPASQTTLLRELLNAPDRIAAEDGAAAPEDLPLIGPEIYARYHAAATRVDTGRDTDWFGELNLRPVDRVTAGLGTRVVQRDQEPLMQSAWAQVGEIDDVNAQLRRAQLARFAMGSLHSRHLSVLDEGALLQTTRAVHARVLADGALTVHGSLVDSSTAVSTVTASARRQTRARGPLHRFLSDDPEAVAGGVVAGLVATDGTIRDHQRPYLDLDGVAGVSESAARALDPVVVASVLGLGDVEPEQAVTALVEHGARVAKTTSLTDALTPEAVDGAEPERSFRLAQEVGALVLARLEQGAEQQSREPAALVRYVSLLRALAPLRGGLGKRADATASELLAQLRRLKEPVGDQEVSADPELTHRLASGLDTPAKSSAAALSGLAADLVDKRLPGTPVRPPFALTGPSLLDCLAPALTATTRILGRFGDSLPSWLPQDWFDDGLAQPIMAAPVFVRPMYQALADYDREWLIPGLTQLTKPDLVTALETNGEFVEAFLVGLSTEMGRELLWRGYPTDQRGTYFRRFWNAEVDELPADIHRFAPTALGSHLLATMSGRIAVLVRGELIRRYPNAMILAMMARTIDGLGHPQFFDPHDNPDGVATVLFAGHLSPDMSIVGFDLQKSQVTTEPWWIVIAEHPTEPRFGLAAQPPPPDPLPPPTRDNLTWGHLHMTHVPPGVTDASIGFLDATSPTTVPDATEPAGSTIWGHDAARNAHLLLVDPIRAAFDMKVLLGPTGVLT